jgi:hypothetical protein
VELCRCAAAPKMAGNGRGDGRWQWPGWVLVCVHRQREREERESSGRESATEREWGRAGGYLPSPIGPVGPAQ